MTTFLLALIASLSQSSEMPAPAARPISCVGEHIQGALLICRTLPGSEVSLGDITVSADAFGWVVLGHDRDAQPETQMVVRMGGEETYREDIAVTQREYDIQYVEGVPQQYVSPPDEVLARIRAEGARKREAYTSRWDVPGFAEGFIMPADGPITGVYGSQRYYNGEPRRPHYGLDMAGPVGTEVVTPADGIVTLADADMYYEGGLIFIDHGQGFTSAFLHLSAVDVEVGQVVKQGDRIGAIGAGGRSTGPHLDWRIKWHDRYIDPALTLDLQPEVLR
ncbi:M23 family metallopeptidase [Woodsholea maritima]|uniref:M23 family metallopeptidase n=1 Tax=Woodsholea maritima TaxID=240237 RepID=UPI00037B60E2|nr:M23 family metallopeptidase [Woodsholea maritima]